MSLQGTTLHEVRMELWDASNASDGQAEEASAQLAAVEGTTDHIKH